ncbi:hypothetical protein ACLB0R_09450 [Sphingomonas sp. GlSt437]|uniref:hypothetical protein n=1 Tax=Sphingomonas sp. GlSt437 TaxID=3389970 RepID=UPI003A8749FE
MSDPLPPLTISELEDWIIEKGDAVIQRRAFSPELVVPEEELVYCLWCVDYGMRNGGDLQPAIDLKQDLTQEGRRLAGDLKLPKCEALFGLSQSDVEQQYFAMFESVCSELKSAYQEMLERRS